MINRDECQKIIEERLEKESKPIRNKNAIQAFLDLFPPLSSLWKVLVGANSALETEKGRITQQIILDMVVAIDNRLSQLPVTPGRKQNLRSAN